MSEPALNAQNDVIPTTVAYKAVWALLWTAAVVLAFLEVFEYFVTVWYESSIFTHGFFVIPLALFFAWIQRYRFIGLPPAASRLAALLAAGAVLLELLGHIFGVSTVQQIAVVAVLICGVIAFVGWKVARHLWFPLSLLLFVPPLGSELVPVFQSITADLSVWLLGFTPIPAFRDGLYITIPGQVFEVAEACSGIRFFVTCVFLGYVYAAINFTTYYKRWLFLAFAIALPIFANGLRVLGIILLAYYVDIKYAKGFDHLFVGWLFFFIVTGILLLVGFLTAEKSRKHPEVAAHPAWAQHKWRTVALWLILPLVASTLFKLSMSLDDANGTIQVVHDPAVQSVRPERAFAWRPLLNNPDGTLMFSHRVERQALDIFVGWYNDDKPGQELLTGKNRLYDVRQWSLAASQRVSITVQNQPVDAQVLTLASPRGAHRFIVYWYEVPGLRSGNPLKIKLYQGLNKITHQFRGGKLLTVSGMMRSNDSLAEIMAMLASHNVFDVADRATELKLDQEGED